MQIELSKHNPDLHEKVKVLVAPQPAASDLTCPISDEYALQSIYLVKKFTDYRGPVLICAASKPIVKGFDNDCMLGYVNLYDVKHASTFTEEDWLRAKVKDRTKYKNFHGWFFKNPERVIEFPVKGERGFYTISYTRDVIMKYPTAMVVDQLGIDMAIKQASVNV